MMQEWMSSALHVSKEIKNEISKNLTTEEIESLALRYLEAKAERQQVLMVIGTGLLGKSLVEESVKTYRKPSGAFIATAQRVSLNGQKKWKLSVLTR